MILMSWFMGCDLLSHGEDCVLFSAGFVTFCCQYLFYSALEMSPFPHVVKGFFASL